MVTETYRAARPACIFAPPMAFREENGCLKGTIHAAASYCITKGHRMFHGNGEQRACEDMIYLDDAKNGVFAVFDGHGGTGCAEAMSQELPKAIIGHPHFQRGCSSDYLADVFRRVDEEWHRRQPASCPDLSGTTATVAVVSKDSLLLAHVGDSSAVISRNGTAELLTPPHHATVESEQLRVQQLGGVIDLPSSDDDVARVNGELEVTRSLGDFHLTGVTADPDVLQRDLTHEDEFAIIATDGLWDVMTPQGAVDLVKKSLDSGNPAELLAKRAWRERSQDDIGVLVISLRAMAYAGRQQRHELDSVTGIPAATGRVEAQDAQLLVSP